MSLSQVRSGGGADALQDRGHRGHRTGLPFEVEQGGINSTDDFLEHCASAKGRRQVAATSGLDEAQLLKWANMADLMRIRGIGKQFSELLEAAGVDTIKELRTRRADKLGRQDERGERQEEADPGDAVGAPGHDLDRSGQEHERGHHPLIARACFERGAPHAAARA